MAQMLQVFLWWLVLQIFGWMVLPVSFRIFRWLPGRGYTFAKPLGLLLVSYTLWIGASTGFLHNDFGGVLSAVLLVAGLSAWLYLRGHDKDGTPIRSALPAFLSEHKRLILTVEILFTVALVAWATLRAYAPFKIMPAGGEKFMEIAFLNATLNSRLFPPLDPWLSGFAISYYYFGYVMMAMVTRLTGAAPGVGFDLYDSLLFTLTAVGVFGVVYNLVAGGLRQNSRKTSGRNGQALSFGLIGALLVVVMGNLEGFLEALHAKGLLSLNFWQWLNIPGLAQAQVTGSFYPGGGDWLWWWRASRVLVDDPIHNYNSITEFPFFSFLLGDNHPHVLDLPFVLLAIALALNLLRSQFSRPALETSEATRLPAWWNPVAAVFDGDWLLFFFYALSLGSLGFLNTWDMPIYIGLVALAYGLGRYARKGRLDSQLVLETLALGAGLLLAAVALYILFYLSFSSQAGGILPYVFPPTRLPQYLVMFGTFIFIAASYLFASLVRFSRSGQGKGLMWAVASAWLWVALASIGLFALILLAIANSGAGQQLIQQALSDPSLTAILGQMTLNDALQTILVERLADPWLFLLLSLLLALALVNLGRAVRSALPGDETGLVAENSHASSLFAFLLIFVGLALTFSVEFFYLRDNFGVRMNTVFKFYYQGWVMLGIASGYALWWLANEARQTLGAVPRAAIQTGSLVLIAAGMVYPFMGTYSRAGAFQTQPNLNGASEIAQSNPDDWAAIQWLRKHALSNSQADDPPEQGVPVILEAPADSYKYEGRISAFSGLPAVLGWAGHEAQWRGSYVEQGKREPDIQTIYTTSDGQQALDLLHKWNVRYVIVGQSEQNFIQKLCSDPARSCNVTSALRKFEAVLKPVFQQGSTAIYEVPGS